MTRSHRKTPIIGITTAASDKPYKTREHRRERRAVGIALRVDGEIPHRRLFGDENDGDKDGKQYVRTDVETYLRK